MAEPRRFELGLAAVRELREARRPATAQELDDFETDVLAGFVLARAAAGVKDDTVRGDVCHLEQLRNWFERPLWEMEPADADRYFGKVLHSAASATRAARAAALDVYFHFLELRHKVEIYHLTGRVVECPLDEMNRPRASVDPKVRIPPTAAELQQLFDGWREELTSCRKYAPAARSYTVARLAADVGLRVNEARMLDLADVRWELGRFGKLNVRHGKGARRKGPKQRLVPLINGADKTLRWFVEDVWAEFGGDHQQPGVALFPSERRGRDRAVPRAGTQTYRTALAAAAERHLPSWAGSLTPHVLRHFCASELYQGGMDLLAIQELLGHSWVVTTMRYIHVHQTRVEDAWLAAEQRAQARWKGLAP